MTESQISPTLKLRRLITFASLALCPVAVVSYGTRKFSFAIAMATETEAPSPQASAVGESYAKVRVTIPTSRERSGSVSHRPWIG